LELATAAARWRPHGDDVRVASAEEARGKRGAEVGEVEGDAWEGNAVGGGARGAAPVVSGGGRSRAGAKRRRQRKKKQQVSAGLICKFRDFQGLLCKEKIPVDTKA
jgi:hypothetical protein